MIRTEKKMVSQMQTFVVSIDCDKCHKDLGTSLENITGAIFTPQASWCSWIDGSYYERIQIVLCDDCCTLFFDEFVDDPLKKEEEDDPLKKEEEDDPQA